MFQLRKTFTRQQISLEIISTINIEWMSKKLSGDQT